MPFGGGLHDLIEPFNTLFYILDERQLQGNPFIDHFSLIVLKANLIQTDDLIHLSQPTRALASCLKDSGIVIASHSQGSHNMNVSDISDDLASLVQLESTTKGGRIIHVFNTTLNKFVKINGRTLLLKRSIPAILIVLVKVFNRPKSPFSIHDFQDGNSISLNRSQTNRMINPTILNGIFKLLKFASADALGLRLPITIGEPARIAIDELTVLAGDSLLGKFNALSLHEEHIAIHMPDFTVKFIQNPADRIGLFHDSLRDP